MKFARWVFRIAGIYGIVAMAPMLFMERQIAPGAAWLFLAPSVLKRRGRAADPGSN